MANEKYIYLTSLKDEESHKGMLHYGETRFKILRDNVLAMEEGDEGYHMGHVYLLEMIATMYYAMQLDGHRRGYLLATFNKLLERTKGSGIIETAAAAYDADSAAEAAKLIKKKMEEAYE